MMMSDPHWSLDMRVVLECVRQYMLDERRDEEHAVTLRQFVGRRDGMTEG